MVRRSMLCVALIATALALTETAAIAQSAAGQLAALRLLDGCRFTQFTDVIFVGRTLAAVTPRGPLVPVQVETAFRGVNANMVSMSWLGDSTLNAGQSYLMFGLRTGMFGVAEVGAHPHRPPFAPRNLQRRRNSAGAHRT